MQTDDTYFIPANGKEFLMKGEAEIIMTEIRKYYVGIDLGGTFIKGGIVDDLGNILVQWQSMANIERYEDMGNYEKAQEEANYILEKAPFLPSIYEDYFKTEIVYLGALLGNDAERVEKYVKELEKRNLAKNWVNSARAQYAYLKLAQKDAGAVSTALKFFEKKIGKEPYQSSKDFERRQMQYIDSLAE